nr:integrase, catalytic region, zinc finger, CCHC-type, peptidase aspartic, catalytic [Tanacetum cinerariifolium]
MIGDPSRSVSTRKQLKTDAIWCYFDAFPTSVKPRNFKQAMTEPSILIDGASWSIDVDTRESAKSTALGAAATGTRETTIDVGVKYSSNID